MLNKILDKFRFRDTYTEPTHVIDNPDTFKWDGECDLAVAGFGGAGAAAALEAHEQGLETVVFDRFKGGGATAISGGIFYAGGGTRLQKESGYEDSSENMFNYLKLEVQGAVSDETLKDFCDKSVINFDWMEGHGVPFDASFCSFKTSYPPDDKFFYYSGNESFPPYSDVATPAPRGHRGHRKGMSGAAIFEPMRDSVMRKKIQVETNSRVVALLSDTEGRVIGLKTIRLSGKVSRFVHNALYTFQFLTRYGALFWPPLFSVLNVLAEKIETTFGDSRYIRARKGVVMSTGGFYVNQKWIKEHAPDYVGGSPLGTISDDGSGISLAIDMGAKTELMDSVSAWRFINPPMAFTKGVIVGPSGQRICNEMLYGAQLGEQMMKKHEGKGYVILDDKTYKSTLADLKLDRALWFHVMLGAFYLWLGNKKDDTLAGLARKLDIDPNAMVKTIEDYNAVAASDEPDSLGKPKSNMPVLGDGPYHAIDASYHYFFVPCPSLTLGGLKVDEKSGLTVREDGSEIPGLYAAGRTAVGIPSRGYVSGLSIADCIYSGRRAAQHAATT